MDETRSVPTTVHICVTCRDANDIEDGDHVCKGQRLYDACKAIEQSSAPNNDIVIEPVECLAVCKRPVTIAFTGPDKLTYVFGDLDPATAAEDVFKGAEAYGRSETGLMAWRDRPIPLRRGTIARIPPAPPLKTHQKNEAAE